MKLLFLALCCLFYTLQPARASEELTPYNQYLQERWSIEDGLLQVVAQTITQDPDGYIWIGSQFGLTRFDGVKFEAFSEKKHPFLGAHVRKLFVDSNGKVWIGSNMGLQVYKNRRFHQLLSNEDNSNSSISELSIFDIVEHTSGNVIVSSNKGVFDIVDESLQENPLYPKEAAFGLFAENGEVWIGGVGHITHIKNGRSKKIYLSEGQGQVRIENISSHDGQLWVGSTAGLYRLIEQKLEKFDLKENFNNLPITTTFEDSNKVLWVTTNEGIFRLKSSIVQEFTANSNPRAFQVVLSIFEDREENIWMGSYVHGVAKLTDAFAENFGTEAGLSDPVVWSIQRNNQGGLYVGTNNGLELFANNEFTQLIEGSELPHPVVYTQLMTPEGLIIGTRTGAAIYNNGKLTVPDSFKALAHSHIRGILRLKKDEYLMATDRGVFHVSNSETKLYSKDSKGNDIVSRALLRTTDDRILIGSKNGIYQLKNDEVSKLYPLFETKDNLEVASIYEDPDGTLIFGTASSGLIYNKNEHWEHFGGVRVGLPSPGAFSIMKDSNEFLWISSFNALYRIPYANLEQLRLNQISKVEADHVLDDTGNVLGAEKSSCCTGGGTAKGFIQNDVITLPSRSGVIQIKGLEYSSNTYKPYSLVESVTSTIGTYEFEPETILELDNTSRDLEFNFTTFSFISSKNNLIQYKLIGYDKTWKTLPDSSNRSAVYTNLPHGRYSFVVKGSSTPGVWGLESQPLSFSIDPYYYETWYFYSLIVLLLVSALLGVHRLRVVHLEKQKLILKHEVDKKTEIMLAVVEVGKQITTGFDLHKTMDSIYINIKSFMSADNFGIGLFSKDRKYLEYDYTVTKGVRQPPYKRELTNDEELPIWCVKNHKPIFINDIDKEGSHYIANFSYNTVKESAYVKMEATPSNKVSSTIYVPIIFNHQVLGLIGIQSFQKDQYKPHHLDMLQSIANYTAIAINNNQTYERMVQSQQREKKIMKEQKRIAESANEAKSQFLATMSHEIRTPMNGVIGMVELLKSTELKNSQKHYVDTIYRSGKILLGVINDILDYSKIEANKIELESVEMDLSRVVDDCVNLFEVAAKKNRICLLSTIIPNTPTRVMGDSIRLSQLLINLLSNAFKFTVAGTIALKINEVETLDSHLSLLKISVQDTGIGIDHERQERIFDSFSQSDNSTTRKYGGTGLGLAICKRLAEMMGGEIGVNSVKNKGSTFWFTVQLEKSRSPKISNDKNPPPDDDSAFEKVLFIGQSSLLLENLKEYMNADGVAVELHKINLDNATVEEVLPKSEPHSCYLIDKACLVNKSEECIAEFAAKIEKFRYRVNIFDSFQYPIGSTNKSLERLISTGKLNALNTPVSFEKLNASQGSDLPETQQLAGVKALSNAELPDFQHIKTLVAEDNEINRIVIKSMLRKFNVTPLIVENGKEAVEAVKLAEVPFDLILMDCEMPEMDGFQATREIRKFEIKNNSVKTNIAALTAHTMPEQERSVYRAGMDRYLTKPVSMGTLLSVIEKLNKIEFE